MVDGVEQAGAEEFFSRVRFENFQVAGAEFEGPLEMLDSFFELIDAGERAIEFDAFGARDAGDVDAGIIIVERDHEIWIGLVIDEADVEARLDVFDEAILGQKRLDFAFGLEVFEIHHVLDHLRLEVLQPGAGLKIGADAVAQGGCFAHINHPTLVVLHQVNTGAFGKGFGLLVEVLDAFIHRFIDVRPRVDCYPSLG